MLLKQAAILFLLLSVLVPVLHCNGDASSETAPPPRPAYAIRCPTRPDTNQAVIYSSREDAFPDKQCFQCALRVRIDNDRVIVRCYQCQKMYKSLDPTPESQKLGC